MFVFKAGVVGAGAMGAEIAHAIASAGIPVVLADLDERHVDAGIERALELTRSSLARLVASGRMTEAQAQAQELETRRAITGTTSLAALGDVDLVIEAVPEPLELKETVIAALDASTPGHAVLASTTSLAHIDVLAGASTRPERVVGMHFFAPASVVRLVELVAGPRTSARALAGASSFLAQIRKTAIRVTDSPGFVVHRVLFAGVGELWRAQQEDGLSVEAIDRAISDALGAALAPFALADRIGLDVVLSVSEHLRGAYGDRFQIHPQLRDLVARGEIGLRAGRGFYEDGRPRGGAGELHDVAGLVERFELRTFVEACLVLEDGVAGAVAIDTAMAAGAGLDPPPFARADAAGLDVILDRLERAAVRWGPPFTPPAVLRRLVAQRRLGAASGQGFFPAALPDAGQAGPVATETRGDVAILWLDHPPANSVSPAVAHALRTAWDALVGGGTVRAVVLASTRAGLFCAGADIKAMAAMDEPASAALIGAMNDLLLDWGRSRIVVVAAVGGLAYGGGCELAMAADLRIASQSASFAQPEIRLGIIPGWGGTQRLPRLVGAGRALEMNLTGEPIDAVEAWELGLVSDVVPDHELLDVALGWARRLAAAAPVAVEEIKRLASGADLAAGLEAERAAFARVFASQDGREGTAAFLEKRPPRFAGS
jgi:enoyl-CoA hydratase/3-hydroxyacyl-CoA dehydrogenase